jgi:hypothetical protein
LAIGQGIGVAKTLRAEGPVHRLLDFVRAFSPGDFCWWSVRGALAHAGIAPGLQPSVGACSITDGRLSRLSHTRFARDSSYNYFHRSVIYFVTHIPISLLAFILFSIPLSP